MADAPVSFQPNCVAAAILCAWTARLRGKQVRISITKISPEKNIDHAQAEYLKGNKWIPLTNQWDREKGQLVQEWQRHHPNIEPYRYVPLEDFVKEQFQVIGQP